MITLNVTYMCIPGKRNAFLEAIQKEGIDEASRAEDGNLSLDWESYFTEHSIEIVHPGELGVACTVDGKGC